MVPMQEFDKITERVTEMNMHSLTSREYRIGVMKLLDNLTSQGSIIEVGCCHGGFAVILARQAYLDGREVYAVDILPKSVAETAYAVKYISADYELTVPTIHEGDFFSFAVDNANIVASAIIIDASHEFYHVYEDICTAFLFFPNTDLLVFHDYALRELSAPNVIVDKAIHSILGDDAWLIPLGNSGTGDVISSEWGSYYAMKGKPEGVAIWRKHIPIAAYRRAVNFFTAEMSPKFVNYEEAINAAAMRIFAE